MPIGDDITAGQKIATFISSGGLDQALALAQTTLADGQIAVTKLKAALDELDLVMQRAQQTAQLFQDGLK
jgi:hypothetical protein